MEIRNPLNSALFSSLRADPKNNTGGVKRLPTNLGDTPVDSELIQIEASKPDSKSFCRFRPNSTDSQMAFSMSSATTDSPMSFDRAPSSRLDSVSPFNEQFDGESSDEELSRLLNNGIALEDPPPGDDGLRDGARSTLRSEFLRTILKKNDETGRYTYTEVFVPSSKKDSPLCQDVPSRKNPRRTSSDHSDSLKRRKNTR